MKILITPSILVFLLGLINVMSFAEAWSNGKVFWHRCRVALSTATIASTQFFLPLQVEAASVASESVQVPQPVVRDASMLNNVDKKLLESLKAPTADKPQIKLPANMETRMAEKANEKTPIVEGLVYLADPKSETRPGPQDTLVLTAASFSNPNQVLAGARIPVSKARFPLAFRMFKENALSDKVDEWLQVEKQDILVKAKICPQGIQLPCSDTESTLNAKGIAKAVTNLPGLPEGVTLRAAASLPLQ